ncbi:MULTISPECIES: hypothetical protein [Thermomonosporaceae]|uniref:hypothetical protein n=1 Tax=Thermomonosporaceae TaxID=2012 RepID=UPI00255ACD8B|nr:MULTISPECIES: hypothetical protein [Thermomonosporaceae]MDL4773945.1 hypothetical protein [Actinomadura xylanilytica]
MYLQFVLWDLKRSSVTVDDLRGYLRDYAVDAYSKLAGMRLKMWFGDERRQVWGAVYLWDGAAHMDGPARVTRAIELIGYPPTSVSVFPLEAIAEGVSAHPDLTALGRAFAPIPSAGT